MISAYRLVQRKWLAQAFNGEGAKLNGGRWNSIGVPCVYATSSESLSILEVLVHTSNSAILKQYALLKFEFDDNDLMQISTEDLPSNWQTLPAPEETAILGDDWIASKQCLALAIPSVIVPRESNYLINIDHPSFNALLNTVQELDFNFDERLF